MKLNIWNFRQSLNGKCFRLKKKKKKGFSSSFVYSPQLRYNQEHVELLRLKFRAAVILSSIYATVRIGLLRPYAIALGQK